MELGHQVEVDLDLDFGQELPLEECWDISLEIAEIVAGVMVIPRGVAHMDIDPTLVGGAVGEVLEVVVGAPVVVDGTLSQGEVVDPAHEPLQDLVVQADVDDYITLILARHTILYALHCINDSQLCTCECTCSSHMHHHLIDDLQSLN